MRRPIGRILACMALILALQAAPIAGALADGGRHGWYGRGYNHHYRHRHGHGHDAAVGVVVFLGGMLLGHLLTRSYEPYYREPIRSGPQWGPPRGLGNCTPTTGEGVVNGRRALLSGTWCTDRYGRGYILQDSVRFVRYLN